MIHEVKTHPEPFDCIWEGRKTAEFRRDDRSPRFEVGDGLLQREYDPEIETYTGREALHHEISDVRRGGDYGIPDGFVMLSLTPPETWWKGSRR